MSLMRCYLTQNRCYRERKIKPRGIMIHSTGANNPYIRRYVQPYGNELPGICDPVDRVGTMLGVNKNHNDWNRPDVNVCVHAFIGKLADGTVAACQTLPWDTRGWHAGAGTSGKSANDTHISFEICEDDLSDRYYFEDTKNEAVMLVACLCLEYDLDPMKDGVIICHQDGYKRGIASNHGDIYNWWPKFGYTMDDFREEVRKKLIEWERDENDMIYYAKLEDVPDYYRAAVEKCIEKGAIKGEGGDVLNLSEDLCRTLTILDRLGNL